MKRINYGIEFGRILTMIMVMALHILLQGGLLKSSALFSIHGQILIFMEYFLLVAVNVFGMISGFVMVNGQYKVKRLVLLWLQVVFYSYLILVVVSPFYHLNMRLIITSLLPTMSNQYWYFNSYLVMFLFIPYLNKGIKLLSKKDLGKAIVFMFLILSVFSSVTGSEKFYVNSGYSPIWLMFLYIVGAYVKLYPAEIMQIKYKLLKYIILTVAMVFLHDGLNFILFNLQGEYEQHWFLLRYSFPIVSLMSVIFLTYIVGLEFSNKAKKLIVFFSKHSFAAYLVQTNIIVFDLFLKNAFVKFASLNIALLVLLVAISAISCYVASVLMDKLRELIFKLLKIDSILDGIFRKE